MNIYIYEFLKAIPSIFTFALKWLLYYFIPISKNINGSKGQYF